MAVGIAELAAHHRLRSVLLCLLWSTPTLAFFEELFGGGGQAFHFEMGGGRRGQRLRGYSRRNSRERLMLTFHRIFDHEAVDLDKDLYEVLGIPEDSDEATIKKVYRKLSIQYHPDKNPDEASKAKFAEIRAFAAKN
eukprot:g24305.t1